MKRNLLGALAVASGLTLWTSVAGFAGAAGDAKAFADTQTAAVGTCQTDTIANLDAIATTSNNAEATQEAKDAIAAAKDEVNDIAMDARLDIASALADFKDAIAEPDEDEPAPSLDAFKSLVSGIREQACNEMTNVYTATKTEVTEILADAAENDEHVNAAAADRDNNRDKGERERQREREREHGDKQGAEVERD